MIELERTYLAKSLPDLTGVTFKQMLDIYLPISSDHPVLRVRQNGDVYEITKKYPKSKEDYSEMIEQTIPLKEVEFQALSQVEGKRVSKRRYLYDYHGQQAEIDVFEEDLKGLVMIDFEFASVEAKDAFEQPDFCLVEVTQDKSLVGGKLCGKTLDEIKPLLDAYNYKEIL